MTADKQALRRRSWSELREAGAAGFPGVEGRIPNFVGAEVAAARLAQTEQWRRAAVLKCNPDSPQLPVRRRALEEGKTVYMAVPKLASVAPFWRLDPDELDVSLHRAASIKGASEHGVPVTLSEMRQIELIVCGSVAVERSGSRLGKSGGYSDLEFAITTEVGLVGPWTAISTTVHPSQVVEDGAIPVMAHDFPLDLIVTPDEVIVTTTGLARPHGVLSEHLDDVRRSTIPILADR